MNSNENEFDLQGLAKLVLDGDPAVLAEVLTAAERLQERGKLEPAAEVLRRFAQPLMQPECPLPPLARCHVFARLGGVLAELKEFSQAETWLRRAVVLAEAARLSELSRRDFQGRLDRLLESRRAKPDSAPPKPSRRTDETGETLVATVSCSETLSNLDPAEARRVKAMASLSQDDRELLELRVGKNFSVEKIAELKQWAPEEALKRCDAAKSRLKRALNRLDAAEATASRNLPAPAQPK